MKSFKVTELEKKVLEALAQSMYAEYGFSDAGLDDIKAITKLNTNVIRGVASSLIKKGYIDIDDREDQGYKNNPNMHIWYLINGMDGLVEHWVNEGYIEPVTLTV